MREDDAGSVLLALAVSEQSGQKWQTEQSGRKRGHDGESWDGGQKWQSGQKWQTEQRLQGIETGAKRRITAWSAAGRGRPETWPSRKGSDTDRLDTDRLDTTSSDGSDSTDAGSTSFHGFDNASPLSPGYSSTWPDGSGRRTMQQGSESRHGEALDRKTDKYTTVSIMDVQGNTHVSPYSKKLNQYVRVRGVVCH